MHPRDKRTSFQFALASPLLAALFSDHRNCNASPSPLAITAAMTPSSLFVQRQRVEQAVQRSTLRKLEQRMIEQLVYALYNTMGGMEKF